MLVNNYLNKYISQPHLLTYLLSGNFTNHKKEIKQKFYKKYGNTRMQTLQFKLTLLKQDEKATSRKTTHDKSFIVNSIVTRNRYSTTSRVAASL